MNIKDKINSIIKEEVDEVNYIINFINDNSDYEIYYDSYKNIEDTEMFFGYIIEIDNNKEIFLELKFDSYDYYVVTSDFYNDFKIRINEIYDKILLKQKIEQKLQPTKLITKRGKI